MRIGLRSRHEISDFPVPCHWSVGDQGSVASPRHGLGPHDRLSSCSAIFYKYLSRFAKLFCLHVSGSLRRIESYGSLVILATNQRAHIDEAFIRRFQAIIHFPMPRPEERCQIWRQAFPKQIEIASDIDWRQVAARYELTGAGIMNVTQYCAVEALADRSCAVTSRQLEAAILREFTKEGRIV